MAVLTPQELDQVRQPWARERTPAQPKAKINAAVQAVEDTFTGAAVQNALSAAIDAALTPATMNAAEKRALVKHWLRGRFERGN